MNESNNAQTTDVLILGAGPGGYAAAFHAADRGLDVTLVDPEENPGGVCLYRGCVPSKALLHAMAFLHETEEIGQTGIHIGKPQVDIDQLRNWKDSVIERLTGGLGKLCEQRKVSYMRGRAHLLARSVRSDI